jgi:hypothetical protein
MARRRALIGQYVVSTNSVHPIDLGCLALLALDGRVRSIRVLVSDRVRVSPQPELRRKQPQYSLPLPRAQREEGGVVRQSFVPLGELAQLTPKEAVGRIGLDGAPESVRRRASDVFEALGPNLSVHSVVQQVFKMLVPNVTVTVEDYETLVWSDEGQVACRSALGALARQAIGPSDSACRVRWRKGGYVEVAFGDRQERVDTITLRRDGDGIYVDLGSLGFLARDDYGHQPAVGARLLDGPKQGNARLALRGPLELAFVAMLGQLGHIPWYCDDVSSANGRSLP